jgi:hypothetical protein
MDERNPNQPEVRRFHAPYPTGGRLQFSRMLAALPAQQFQPLPPPAGQPPFHLSLEQVLPAANMQDIADAGRLVFHMVGDTGGVKSPQPQQITAMHMESDFNLPNPGDRPAFFYHLGDVVYYYGATSEYYSQFYEPYKLYPAPIFAIPGNHDGDVDPTVNPPPPSLEAFVRNFCAAAPVMTPEAGDAPRQAMTQPNVYWTLEAPFVTIVGLYTNVPEGGVVQPDQVAWFTAELQNAPADKALLVALHHPIYSADSHHGGSQTMGQMLDQAMQNSGRTPDAVFTAHVHDYQRFTRTVNGRQIPYIVAGAGGYWNLHYVSTVMGVKPQTPFVTDDPTVTLDSYCDDRHGYLRLDVNPRTLRGEYFSVPRPQESWNAPAQQVDTFTIDLQQHRVIQ